MLLVAIHNVQFVDKATRAIMGRWHYVHAAVWHAVAGVGRLCGRSAAVRGRRERHEGGSTTMLVVGAAVLFDSIKMLKKSRWASCSCITGPWVPSKHITRSYLNFVFKKRMRCEN